MSSFVSNENRNANGIVHELNLSPSPLSFLPSPFVESDDFMKKFNFDKIVEKIRNLEKKSYRVQVIIGLVGSLDDSMGFDKNVRGDELLASVIERTNSNCLVVSVPWDDDSIDWTRFHLLILRGCYNYIHHVTEFRRWLDLLEHLAVPLCNSVDVVRQNLEKTYLRRLEEKGLPDRVRLPKTWWFDGIHSDDIFDFKAELIKKEFKRGVIKPIIGCDSYTQWCFSISSFDQNHDRQLRSQIDSSPGVMIQEYIEAIDFAWEVNLVFIARRFSHAVVRSPVHGPARVKGKQRVRKCRPDEALVKAASRVLDLVEGELLYARVDVVVDNGEGRSLMDEGINGDAIWVPLHPSGVVYLMEVELIEPNLFLNEKSAATLGRVVQKIFKRAQCV